MEEIAHDAIAFCPSVADRHVMATQARTIENLETTGRAYAHTLLLALPRSQCPAASPAGANRGSSCQPVEQDPRRGRIARAQGRLPSRAKRAAVATLGERETTPQGIGALVAARILQHLPREVSDLVNQRGITDRALDTLESGSEKGREALESGIEKGREALESGIEKGREALGTIVPMATRMILPARPSRSPRGPLWIGLG